MLLSLGSVESARGYLQEVFTVMNLIPGVVKGVVAECRPKLFTSVPLGTATRKPAWSQHPYKVSQGRCGEGWVYSGLRETCNKKATKICTCTTFPFKLPTKMQACVNFCFCCKFHANRCSMICKPTFICLRSDALPHQTKPRFRTVVWTQINVTIFLCINYTQSSGLLAHVCEILNTCT